MKWLTLILAPIGAISMKNWILVWVFLEFSSMSFILLSKNKSSSESLLKYFLIQTLGSTFILLSLSMESLIKMKEIIPSLSFSSTIIIMSLMLKAGMAPIHFWMIQISKKLEKTILFLFLSIQKLAPIMIILSTSKMQVFSFIIFINSLVGTISQIYSLNLNILLTFSSISHSSWLLLSGMNSKEMFFTYFFIYTMILYQIIINLKLTKTSNIMEMEKNNNSMIMFLSLGGLPPLLGFFPKWLTISFSIEKEMVKILCLFLMIMACLNIFIYLRIFSSLMLKTPKSKSKSENNSNFSLNILINTSPIVLFLVPKM